ncbi:MAG: phosphatase PAP2 family protein [Actinomycetota bacterium]|nr:phosphatase PAP2 family protein [Actinomycetota bacterium]
MLRREFLRREISSRLSGRLGFALTVELVTGLLLSLGIIILFAQIVDEVFVEDETRRFDKAVLLWIHDHSPGWFYEPMLFVTALGYYWVVLPLSGLATYAFYRVGFKVSAALLLTSVAGGLVLTTVLKSVFQRARPELFDSSYTGSLYSFPSAHATVAVGFYGTLALLVAWRLKGFWRWTVISAGAALVLLIGFSRLYLGVHYPTDIIAGYLAAPLWVGTIGLCYFLWRALHGPRKASQYG